MNKIIITLAIVALTALAVPATSYAQYGGGGGGIISPSVIRAVGNSGGFSFNRPPVITQGQVLGEASFKLNSHMTIGSRGEEVTELQKRLRTEGFFNMEPTGYFGSITQEAVKNYQSSKGLPGTGYVGALTLAQLNSNTVSTAVDTAQVASIKTQVVGLMQQAIKLLQAQLAATIAAGNR